MSIRLLFLFLLFVMLTSSSCNVEVTTPTLSTSESSLADTTLLQAMPSNYDFGTLVINDIEKRTLYVTFLNSSDQKLLNCMGPSFSDNSEPQFEVISTSCSNSMSPRQSCSAVVSANPQSLGEHRTDLIFSCGVAETFVSLRVTGQNPSLDLIGPSVSSVNSESSKVSYLLKYTGYAQTTLKEEDIALITTGDAEANIKVSGSGQEYLISLSDFAGNGTIDLDIKFGNWEVRTDTDQQLIVDNSEPSVASLSSLSLSSPSLGVTSKNRTPILEGKLSGESAGCRVIIYSDNSCNDKLGYGESDEDGDFQVSNVTFPLGGASDGEKHFYAQIKDSAGNLSSCIDTSLHYTLDTLPPVDPGGWSFDPALGPTSNETSPSISNNLFGVARVDESIDFYLTSQCTGTPIDTFLIVSGGLVNKTLNLTSYQDGEMHFYVVLYDFVGNRSHCINTGLSYELKRTTPEVEIIAPGVNDYILNSNVDSFNVTGNCSGGDGNNVTITWSDSNGATANVSQTILCSSGNWSGDFDLSSLSDGTVTLTVNHQSNWGETAIPETLTLQKDSTIPIITPSEFNLIGGPSDGGTSNDSTPIISRANGSDSGGRIDIYENSNCTSSILGSDNIGISGQINVLIPQYNTDGVKHYYAKMSDAYDNESSCTDLELEYELDTMPPSTPSTVSFVSITNGGVSNDTTPSFSLGWPSSEEGGNVNFFSGSSCNQFLESFTISSSNPFQFTLTNQLSQGIQSFSMKLSDNVVNETNCINLGLSYTLDTTSPGNPSGSIMPTDGSTSHDVTPLITGTSDKGILKLYLNSSDCSSGYIKSVAIANDGVQFTIDDISFSDNGSDDGEKSFYIRTFDLANNFSGCVSVGRYYLNTASSVRQVTTGQGFSCALLNDLSVKCFGKNEFGQLGQGQISSIGDTPSEMGSNLSPINLGIDRKAIYITSGETHTCALLDNLTVKCWGKGEAGKLGSGSNLNLGDDADEMGDNLSPINLGTNRFPYSISAGVLHTCAILEDSKIKCWGSNDRGELGLGNRNWKGDDFLEEMGDNLSFVDLGNNYSTKALSVKAGLYYTCALTDNSDMKCWGSNQFGELGGGPSDHLGDNSDEMGNNLSIVVIPGPSKTIQFDVGESSVCAVNVNGQMYCWGKNSNYQLGLGDNSNRNIPVLSQTGTKKVYHVSMGQQHACILSDDGRVRCWGTQFYGELGKNGGGSVTISGQLDDNLIPVDLGESGSIRALSLSAGYQHSCAITSNGILKCWGGNSNGQLGVGHNQNIGDNAGEMGNNNSGVRLSSLPFVQAIQSGGKSGNDHFCALLSNGSLRCWGKNSSGQLGIGNTNSVDNGNSIVNIGLNGNRRKGIRSVSTGSSHSCIVTDNFDVKCWGDNIQNQLAISASTARLGDNYLEMGDNLSILNFGGKKVLSVVSGASHSCALFGDSTFRCWGDNSFAQLGLGNIGGTNFDINAASIGSYLALSAGNSFTCGLRPDSKVECWGSGNLGQIGNENNLSTFFSGKIVVDLSDVGGGNYQVVKIFSGGDHSCALRTDGTIKCWGANDKGQLGVGSTSNIGDGANDMGSFLSTVNLGSDRKVLSMALGEKHSCTLLDDRTVKCWGRNDMGQLGLGDNSIQHGDHSYNMGDNLPSVNLGTGVKVLAISASSNSSCALLDNNQVKCWGDNSVGQLGQGNSGNIIGDSVNEMGDNLSPTIINFD